MGKNKETEPTCTPDLLRLVPEVIYIVPVGHAIMCSRNVFVANYKVIIGLANMFLSWILGLFNVQIQNERGHKFM